MEQTSVVVQFELSDPETRAACCECKVARSGAKLNSTMVFLWYSCEWAVSVMVRDGVGRHGPLPLSLLETGTSNSLDNIQQFHSYPFVS